MHQVIPGYGNYLPNPSAAWLPNQFNPHLQSGPFPDTIGVTNVGLPVGGFSSLSNNSNNGGGPNNGPRPNSNRPTKTAKRRSLTASTNQNFAIPVTPNQNYQAQISSEAALTSEELEKLMKPLPGNINNPFQYSEIDCLPLVGPIDLDSQNLAGNGLPCFSKEELEKPKFSRPAMRRNKLKRQFNPFRDRIDYSHISCPKERRRLRSLDNARLYRDKEKQRIMTLEGGIEYFHDHNTRLHDNNKLIEESIKILEEYLSKNLGQRVCQNGIPQSQTHCVAAISEPVASVENVKLQNVASPMLMDQAKIMIPVTAIPDAVYTTSPHNPTLAASTPLRSERSEQSPPAILPRDPAGFLRNRGPDLMSTVETDATLESDGRRLSQENNDLLEHTNTEFSLNGTQLEEGALEPTLPDLSIPSENDVLAMGEKYRVAVREPNLQAAQDIANIEPMSTSILLGKVNSNNSSSKASSGSRNKLGLSLDLTSCKLNQSGKSSNATSSTMKTIIEKNPSTLNFEDESLERARLPKRPAQQEQDGQTAGVINADDRGFVHPALSTKVKESDAMSKLDQNDLTQQFDSTQLSYSNFIGSNNNNQNLTTTTIGSIGEPLCHSSMIQPDNLTPISGYGSAEPSPADILAGKSLGDQFFHGQSHSSQGHVNGNNGLQKEILGGGGYFKFEGEFRL